VTAPDDGYWDDLGVAWRAINPDITVIVPRLEARLRRQSVLIRSALVVGLPLSVIGLGLGVFTIWRGWTTGAWNFVTRGSAIVAIAILLAAVMSSLLPVRAGDAARAVSDMLDLAIARAQRTVIAIRLGLIAGAVAAAMGLAGTAIRSQLNGPPRMSPVVDVVLLAMCAIGLFAWRRDILRRLEQLRALKRALDANGQA
jgi:uncharacterized protein YacL